jgi:hypothetical protein
MPETFRSQGVLWPACQSLGDGRRRAAIKPSNPCAGVGDGEGPDIPPLIALTDRFHGSELGESVLVIAEEAGEIVVGSIERSRVCSWSAF